MVRRDDPSSEMFLLQPFPITASLVTAPHQSLHPARHGCVVARELSFVANLEVVTEPFEVGTKPVGEWFAQEEALKILMSQAESSRRLDSAGVDPGGDMQRWEVITPIQFPGMVARSETPMDIQIDRASPRLVVSSGESKTVCEGGPPWAQGLLARIGDIATTSSSNVIELRDASGGKGKVWVSRVNLAVKLSIPSLLLPPFVVPSFEREGSKSIQALLDKDMGPVLKRFREGYLMWAGS